MLERLEFADRDAGSRGGLTIVLLHGWGDSADGIAPLAPAICPPGARVIIPDGPLPHPWGGRGWWDLDADPPNAGVLAARQDILGLIDWLRARDEPDSVALVGFSQGAMLAADVGLQRESGVDKVAVLSGVMVADSLPALLDPPTRRPAFLVVHGERDEQVPLLGGQAARDLLRDHGYTVEWQPFIGGHDIPDDVADAVRRFLAG